MLSLGSPVQDPVEALVLDLVEWIGPRARPYAEVMDAWRTSCPRLPVWEEANARGFIERQHCEGVGEIISLTPLGHAMLQTRRPDAAAHGATAQRVS